MFLPPISPELFVAHEIRTAASVLVGGRMADCTICIAPDLYVVIEVRWLGGGPTNEEGQWIYGNHRLLEVRIGERLVSRGHPELPKRTFGFRDKGALDS